MSDELGCAASDDGNPAEESRFSHAEPLGRAGPDILAEQTPARSKAIAAGTGIPFLAPDSGFAPESGTAAEWVELAPFRYRFDGELVAYSRLVRVFVRFGFN